MVSRPLFSPWCTQDKHNSIMSKKNIKKLSSVWNLWHSTAGLLDLRVAEGHWNTLVFYTSILKCGSEHTRMSIGAHPFDYGLIEKKRWFLCSRHRTLTGLNSWSVLSTVYQDIFYFGTRVSHSGGSVLTNRPNNWP